MSEHTRGRLFVGQAPRCYAEDGGEVLVATKADPRHRGKAMENAHRAADCWNACEGMDDPAAEIARLRELEGEAYPGIAHDFETAKAERDEALDALDKLFSTLKVRTEPVFDARGRHTGHKLLGELEEQAASLTAHNILRKHGRLS